MDKYREFEMKKILFPKYVLQLSTIQLKKWRVIFSQFATTYYVGNSYDHLQILFKSVMTY